MKVQHRQERPTPSCPLDRMFCTATSFVDTPTVSTGRFDPISPLPPNTSERNSTPTTWTCFPEASRHNIICSSAAATRNRSEHAYVVLITKKIKSNQIHASPVHLVNASMSVHHSPACCEDSFTHSSVIQRYNMPGPNGEQPWGLVTGASDGIGKGDPCCNNPH